MQVGTTCDNFRVVVLVASALASRGSDVLPAMPRPARLGGGRVSQRSRTSYPGCRYEGWNPEGVCSAGVGVPDSLPEALVVTDDDRGRRIHHRAADADVVGLRVEDFWRRQPQCSSRRLLQAERRAAVAHGPSVPPPPA